jgi:hypothetical protein
VFKAGRILELPEWQIHAVEAVRVTRRVLHNRDRYRVGCQALHLDFLDLAERVDVLAAVKDKACCSHAGLRPSLTCAVRVDQRDDRSGRRNDRPPIEQRNRNVIKAQAGMAIVGSNRLPVFNTPKQSTRSLRIAATTICLGLRRPALLRRATRAATAGLKRMADKAGM